MVKARVPVDYSDGIGLPEQICWFYIGGISSADCHSRSVGCECKHQDQVSMNALSTTVSIMSLKSNPWVCAFMIPRIHPAVHTSIIIVSSTWIGIGIMYTLIGLNHRLTGSVWNMELSVE